MKLKDWTRPNDDELQYSLDGMSFDVTRRDGTEMPWVNKYNGNKMPGVYVDVISGELLYASTDKFDSGTGWPSFVREMPGVDLGLDTDYKIGYARTEMRSPLADSHLGHIFPDGPRDRGGMRHCANSASLRFIPKDQMDDEGMQELRELLFPERSAEEL